jgi:nucleotide-binding universal stress UspA family protein
MAETITRILVPVDFSPHAERAFGYATTLAQRFTAMLGLVHVVEDPFATGAWNNEVLLPDVDELFEGLIANAQRQLAPRRRSAVALGLAAETAVIAGRPAPAIVEHANEGGFDLIVMGTHGRTGLSHVVMGSVAERVVRTAPCPVLTVHAAEPAVADNSSAPG